MNGYQSHSLPVEWEDILRIVDRAICDLGKAQLKPGLYKFEYVMKSMQAHKQILAMMQEYTKIMDVAWEAHLRLTKALALEAMQNETNGTVNENLAGEGTELPEG